MGTSLTGLTPATTYDALIKVGDNGPLSATAKILSDGLGNDSPLAMSTSNVGIGTSSPTNRLTVSTTSAYGIQVYRSDANDSRINITNTTTTAGSDKGLMLGMIGNEGYIDNYQSGALILLTADTERMRITSDGYLRMASGTGGIQFNGDTAAANALDDYEEGTFTATLTPSTSGTITANASFSTWAYTKIGRQVTINGAFVISSVSSPVGTLVNIGGLPFTVRNSFDSFGAVSVGYADASASYAKSVLWSIHGTNTTVINVGIDASTVAASDEFYVTATYFTN